MELIYKKRRNSGTIMDVYVYTDAGFLSSTVELSKEGCSIEFVGYHGDGP